MTTEQSSYSGSCLCGQVQYQVKGDPVIVAHCHCRDCQKSTGAGHSTGAMFQEEQVSVEGDLKDFKTIAENGNTVSHLFCETCGSKLFGKNTGAPGYLTIALGTMDQSDDLKPGVVVFKRSRCSWDVMDENIPGFEAQPAWSPDKNT